jgi:phage gp36-like protein
MTAYLTLAEFKLRSTIPPEFVDEIETLQPGWPLAQLEQESRWIDSRLRKRYTVPFAATPEAVRGWLAKIVTLRCWQRRGFDPTDQSLVHAIDEAKVAKSEVEEAANGNTGLIELALADAAHASGVSRGGPLVYSESSPYAWTDMQRDAGVQEDTWGRGTGG